MAQPFFQTMHTRKLYLPDLVITWGVLIFFVSIILAYWLLFTPITVYKFSNDIHVHPESTLIQKMIPDVWSKRVHKRRIIQRRILAKFNPSASLYIQPGQHAWIRMIHLKRTASLSIPSVVIDVRKSKDQQQTVLVTLKAEYDAAHANPFKNAIGGEAIIEVDNLSPYKRWFPSNFITIK